MKRVETFSMLLSQSAVDGVIAVTKDGDVATPFQTMLMYRGVWKHGKITIGIGPNDVDLDSMD